MEGFFRVTKTEQFYGSVGALQQGLNTWLKHYNIEGLISGAKDEGPLKPSVNSVGKKVQRTFYLLLQIVSTNLMGGYL